MTSSVLDPINYHTDNSYVIHVQEVVQAPIRVPKTYSNSQALVVIAKYLDKTTELLRKRRLASR
jgi:hypothetical protein